MIKCVFFSHIFSTYLFYPFFIIKTCNYEYFMCQYITPSFLKFCWRYVGEKKKSQVSGNLYKIKKLYFCLGEKSFFKIVVLLSMVRILKLCILCTCSLSLTVSIVFVYATFVFRCEIMGVTCNTNLAPVIIIQHLALQVSWTVKNSKRCQHRDC